LNESHDVVVIGAGQAGLSISHELTRAGREHVVLERGRVAQSWRTRWDSFTLVLPNWTVRLAGNQYTGTEPDGFMSRDIFVEYMSAYAESFGAPVLEGIEVTSLEPADGGYRLSTSTGTLTAREVVVATGGFQRAHQPEPVRQLREALHVLDSGDYSHPNALPEGDVLVIGSGQTGCQIAEELADAGRTVHLACGKAPWMPRRIGSRDAFWWLAQSPFMQHTVADLPTPMARFSPNPQATGRRGGYDLHYRTLHAGGVTLTGHLAGVEDGRAWFADDLADSVAFADARYRDICGVVAKTAAALGEPVPELPEPAPFAASPPASVELSRIGAAVVCSGYRPMYGTWIRIPEAFDDMGLPLQVDGSSLVAPGLHFMGVPFQRVRGSASLYGVGADAERLAERMSSASPVA
jgi:putative flavoprotein involved in K+ transport